jgi:hypothetical protein
LVLRYGAMGGVTAAFLNSATSLIPARSQGRQKVAAKQLGSSFYKPRNRQKTYRTHVEEWCTGQDLNLEPSDSKSEALSN